MAWMDNEGMMNDKDLNDVQHLSAASKRALAYTKGPEQYIRRFETSIPNFE